MSEALAVRTVEEEAQLLEKQRLKTERKALRKQEAQAYLDDRVLAIKKTAAAVVALKRHMFKTEEELDAVVPKLTQQQRKIIRQWEEPKKATAFGVESSAKLIEAETKARSEKQAFRINVENAVISLPEKQDETIEPVVITVIPDDKR